MSETLLNKISASNRQEHITNQWANKATGAIIDIEGNYAITIPVSETKSLNCNFQPIRIEKANEGGYTISGQFTYNSTHDKMVLTQFCAKRSFEIKNK